MEVHSVVTNRNKTTTTKTPRRAIVSRGVRGHGFWGEPVAYQWETHSLGQVNNRSIHLALR
jgi:hypothetical protein